MGSQRKVKSTIPAPIRVASELGEDYAAQSYLMMLDWLLGDEMNLVANPEGEISAWIKGGGPVRFECHDITDKTKRAFQQALMREFLAILADPRMKEEMLTGNLVEASYSKDLNRIMVALRRGDVSTAEKVCAKLVEGMCQRFTKQFKRDRVTTFGNLAARCRAARAEALCMVLYKEKPISLVDQARGGNKEAVLKLIKIDKLFLTDSSTFQVIRRAELQIDRDFLHKLAKAVDYRPTMAWREGFRLYLFTMFSLGIKKPPLMGLWHRFDPDGGQFEDFGVFKEFFDRSQKEFDQMQS